MTSRSRCRLLLCVIALAIACGTPTVVVDAVARGHFDVPPASGGLWLKGNTHTHTDRSYDGNTSPQVVIDWYRRRGYGFLVLSDHNVLTAPDSFATSDPLPVLIPGEEVTAFSYVTPVHLTALGIGATIALVSDGSATSSTTVVLQGNLDAIAAAGGVGIVNHPNYRWALSPQTLKNVRGVQLIEIVNGIAETNSAGDAKHTSVEAMWDTLLTAGQRVYGVGVDDAHEFAKLGPEQSNPGRAWVVVRVARRDAREILTALQRGRFYTSTGVELADVQVTKTTLTVVIVGASASSFRTEFIGDTGRVLLTTTANPARFILTEGHGLSYVRARVTGADRAAAWTQPTFIVK
jgi:hypothetical protein